MSERLLSLFVSGDSATSQRARSNLALLQSSGLPEGWRVEVIDVLAEPGRAERAGILATPTLAFQHEARPRRIVGDLSDTARVLEFLGIEKGSDDA